MFSVYAAMLAAAMNDHRVPLVDSRCFASACVSFRGCFQFIVPLHTRSVRKKYSISDIFVVVVYGQRTILEAHYHGLKYTNVSKLSVAVKDFLVDISKPTPFIAGVSLPGLQRDITNERPRSRTREGERAPVDSGVRSSTAPTLSNTCLRASWGCSVCWRIRLAVNTITRAIAVDGGSSPCLGHILVTSGKIIL